MLVFHFVKYKSQNISSYILLHRVEPTLYATFPRNIFSNVNLWQLQRLFRAAGDQDAEQRAQLVWGHRDEAELAQALIGLRARSHRRGLRTNGRAALGSHWLQAFNHLR
uniref:Arginine vasopressin-induced protein 1 n=1 Tax=Amphiprion ocellaris TaxID=80972 RepID=A0A3Q1ASN9_AMPOC